MNCELRCRWRASSGVAKPRVLLVAHYRFIMTTVAELPLPSPPTGDQHAALAAAISALKARGFDEASAQWAVKALYPPLNVNPMMPRLTPRPGIAIDNRSVVSIDAPDEVTAGQAWDAMVVVPANEGYPAFVVAGQSPLDFGTSTAPATASTTVTVVASAPRVNQTVICRNNAYATQSNATLWPSSLPASTRNIAKSLTVHMTASALNNGGSLTVGKIPGDGTPADSIAWDNSALGFPSPISTFWSPSNYIVPFDEESLARMCPGVYTGPAREGFFAVNTMHPGDVSSNTGCDVRGKPILALAGATVANGIGYFDPAPDSSNEGAPWPFISYRPCFTTASFSPTSPYSFPWWSIPRNQVGGYSAGLIGRSDTDTTVAFFRGLSHDATLQLTLHSALQHTLVPSSPFTAMTLRPAPANLKLLEAYSQIAAAMPDALPARYNSLALVAPMILNAIKTALPIAMRVVPKIATAVSAAAPVVKDIIDTFRDRDGDKPSRTRPTKKTATTRPRPAGKKPKPKRRGK